MQRSNSGILNNVINNMIDELSPEEIEQFLYLLEKFTTYSKDVLMEWSNEQIREFVILHKQKIERQITDENERYFEFIKEIMIR